MEPKKYLLGKSKFEVGGFTPSAEVSSMVISDTELLGEAYLLGFPITHDGVVIQESKESTSKAGETILNILMRYYHTPADEGFMEVIKHNQGNGPWKEYKPVSLIYLQEDEHGKTLEELNNLSKKEFDEYLERTHWVVQ